MTLATIFFKEQFHCLLINLSNRVSRYTVYIDNGLTRINSSYCTGIKGYPANKGQSSVFAKSFYRFCVDNIGIVFIDT